MWVWGKKVSSVSQKNISGRRKAFGFLEMQERQVRDNLSSWWKLDKGKPRLAIQCLLVNWIRSFVNQKGFQWFLRVLNLHEYSVTGAYQWKLLIALFPENCSPMYSYLTETGNLDLIAVQDRENHDIPLSERQKEQILKLERVCSENMNPSSRVNCRALKPSIRLS